ncbi:putative MFS family arabinose efflux permease [Gibbsiella quercinecans]|uniref:Permease n=1 Tax=Gibbsiella quercinecans TaxID=929813 RepID=A0A250B710_9GAMM|nr:MFS transporter [Gibbsiella quercinecans]ATA21712.1 permease [Gibbsiella quercinecans]TCT88975.1 putative MFS family arabinose efflux permease [Gibbsiella quercinecans]
MSLFNKKTAPDRGWYNFNLLWAGQTLSLLGSQFVVVGMPLLALQFAEASPSQAVLLPFMMYLPFLIIGLPVGAIVDRINIRRIMMFCDGVQTIIYLTIFFLSIFFKIKIYMLMGLVFLSGCANVFFQISYTSVLPIIFKDKAPLQKGNAKLCFSESMVNIVGPFLAGPLISLFGVTVAVAANSLSFLISLMTLGLIKAIDYKEDKSTFRHTSVSVFRAVLDDIIVGIRFVFGHEYLEPIFLCGAMYVLFLTTIDTSLVLYCKSVLGLSSYQIGLVVGAAAAGFPLGNILSSPIVNKLSFARTLVLGATISVCGLVFIPISGMYNSVIGIIIACVIHGFGEGVFNPVALTFRQKESPAKMLGRVNSVHRFLIWGAISVGSLINSIVIHFGGLKAALWIGGCGTLLCLIPLVRKGIKKDLLKTHSEALHEKK